MNRFFQSLSILVLVCVLGEFLSACSSTPKTVYFSLFTAIPPRSIEKSHDDVVLSIGPVSLPDILTRSKIATGGAGGVYNISEYHRWAGLVDRDFARALAEQLTVDIGTEQIGFYPLDAYNKSNCQIMIDILALDGNLGKDAQLTVRWTLIDPAGKLEPFIRRSHFSRQPVDAGYEEWVKAQQENIQQLGSEIAAQVKERLKLQ